MWLDCYSLVFDFVWMVGVCLSGVGCYGWLSGFVSCLGFGGF